MKERASLIWQSAAQLVEDALSKLLGNNMLFPDKARRWQAARRAAAGVER
jgi:hypothetical protein